MSQERKRINFNDFDLIEADKKIRDATKKYSNTIVSSATPIAKKAEPIQKTYAKYNSSSYSTYSKNNYQGKYKHRNKEGPNYVRHESSEYFPKEDCYKRLREEDILIYGFKYWWKSENSKQHVYDNYCEIAKAIDVFDPSTITDLLYNYMVLGYSHERAALDAFGVNVGRWAIISIFQYFDLTAISVHKGKYDDEEFWDYIYDTEDEIVELYKHVIYVVTGERLYNVDFDSFFEDESDDSEADVNDIEKTNKYSYYNDDDEEEEEDGEDSDSDVDEYDYEDDEQDEEDEDEEDYPPVEEIDYEYYSNDEDDEIDYKEDKQVWPPYSSGKLRRNFEKEDYSLGMCKENWQKQPLTSYAEIWYKEIYEAWDYVTVKSLGKMMYNKLYLGVSQKKNSEMVFDSKLSGSTIYALYKFLQISSIDAGSMTEDNCKKYIQKSQNLIKVLYIHLCNMFDFD